MTDPALALVRLIGSRPQVEGGLSNEMVDLLSSRVAGLDAASVPATTALVLSRLLVEGPTVHVDLFEKAARHALLVGEPTVARLLAERALAADPTRSSLAHLAAMSLEAVGHHGAAAAVHAEDSASDPALVGRWWSNLFVSTGFVAAVDVSHDHGNEVVANRIWIEALGGDVSAVEASLHAVLGDVRSSPQAIVWACVAGSLPAALAGFDDAARRLLDHAGSIAAVRAAELTPFAELQIAVARFLVLVRSGRMAAAETFAAEQVSAESTPYMHAIWSSLSGLSLRERGAYAEALTSMMEGMRIFADDVAVPFGLAEWVTSEIEVCKAMNGQMARQSGSPGTAFGLYRCCLHRNDAWIAASSGRLGDAQQHLRLAIDTAISSGQVVHHALAIVDVARFGKPEVARRLLTDLPERPSALVIICREAVVALADRSRDGLIRAHRRVRRHGIEPLASELAALARSAHDRTDAHEQARIELLTVVEPSRSPLLRDHVARGSQLTSREVEIGRAAASGRPSRQIAAELGVSVRTVDNLLGRVYTKTRLASRGSLGDLFRSVGGHD